MDLAECDRARLARDPAYDGRVYTGVNEIASTVVPQKGKTVSIVHNKPTRLRVIREMSV